MPIDVPSSSLEASICDPAQRSAADRLAYGRPAAFLVVWDPGGDVIHRCHDWAARRGGAELWAVPSIAAFGFSPHGHPFRAEARAVEPQALFVGPSRLARDERAPLAQTAPTSRVWPDSLAGSATEPTSLTSSAPASWFGPTSSGVFMGELYCADGIETTEATSARRPDSDGAVAGAPDGTMPPATDPATLIPAAYARWGDELFDRLEGVYCTVLWDHERQRLVLFRDGSCARALYWYRGDDWGAAATRLDILTDIPGVTRTIAPAGLHEYLRFLDVSPPNTIYAGIQALEPGVAARATGANLEYAKPVDGPKEARPGSRFSGSLDARLARNDERALGQDWPNASRHAKTPHPGRGNPGFDTCVDALDDALRASIAARLDRGRPTGCFLSGGIDSALLCAIAASIDREAVDAFTVGFDERGFDERPVAAGIATHLGVRHHCHAYDMATYAQAFDGFAAALDLPFADPAGLPTLLLYRECRKEVDTVLDGTGADTLLGVMPARHLRIATQYAARLPRALRHAVAAVLWHIPGAAGYSPVFDFDRPEDLLIRWKGWTRLEIEALTGQAASLEGSRFFRIYRSFGRDEHFERYSALLGNLPDDRIHQAAELAGLRVRFPFWDRRVEQLVRSLPLEYRYTRTEPKRLLRALLGRYVPRHLWDLPKHGLDFPFVALLRYDSFALIRQYLTSAVLERHGLVAPSLIRDYVRAFQAGDTRLGFRIWALVVLFAWFEHHPCDERDTPG